MECRYLIGGYIDGAIECFVTFPSANCVNMKGLCTVRIGEKEFDIPQELLELIAKPAP